MLKSQIWRLSIVVRNLFCALWLVALIISSGSAVAVSWAGHEPFHISMLFCWFIAAVMAILVYTIQSLHIQRSSEHGDVADVGCWIDTLASYTLGRFPMTADDPRYDHVNAVIMSVKSPLCRHLPKLRHEDRFLLSGAQMQLLYRFLEQDDVIVARAIIHALTEIGDARSVRPVRELASGLGMGAYDAGLRALAAHCLEQIEQRLHELKSPRLLLRGAAEPRAMASELLRPGSAVVAAEHDSLLRPTAPVD